MVKKSAAQIRRMEKRAQARGEEFVYTAPPEEEEEAAPSPKEEEEEKENEDKYDTNDNDNEQSASNNNNNNNNESKILLDIGQKLTKELQEIEDNTDLKAKDRRSMKRKAEAIAAEEAGMPAAELLEFCAKNKNKNSSSDDNNNNDKENKKKTILLEKAAKKLQAELLKLEGDSELKAKDRRSAKRKAEAIAIEESGMTSTAELLEWYEKNNGNKTDKNDKQNRRKKHDPYIAFVGQLSYDTTKDELFQHIKEQLKDEFKIKQSTLTIRILTDAKTKKSRGMAFVEVHDDPKILYGLLKLHQTFLKGRRINIERSVGGKKNNEVRKSKISQFRKEQKEYFDEVVDNILNEYKKTGELRDDELDAGVIALCKRHAGPIVRAAVSKYIEGSGRDMDNPSAYLTYLITKFAKEGLYEEKEGEDKPKHNQKPKRKREGGDSRDDNNNNRNNNNNNKQFKSSSKFSKSGIDMSISESKKGDMTKIFPSAGRGRGRGYM